MTFEGIVEAVHKQFGSLYQHNSYGLESLPLILKASDSCFRFMLELLHLSNRSTTSFLALESSFKYEKPPPFFEHPER